MSFASSIDHKHLKRSGNQALLLFSAARIGLAVFLLNTAAQAQIAIQDGSPLTITHSTGTALSLPLTVTAGAGVLVVILEDKGASLPEPTTLTWNGQTLVREVQTAYTPSALRSIAIYHLYNPLPGTANITGTLGAGVSDKWVTAYTLTGVDTDIAPITRSVNTGSSTTGVTSLSVNASGVAAGSWATVSSVFSNLGTVTITGTGGTATTVSDAGFATTVATAGYVAGLSAGSVTLTQTFVPNAGVGAQKSNFAVAIFTPTSAATVYTPQRFGIKFLGNTTYPVNTTAGVVPMPNWNNIDNGSFTTGSILSSDGSASATLTISGSGGDREWKSGVYPDGGNFSLLYGYQDAARNEPATNVISGLTRTAYDIYLYTGGEEIRPAAAGQYLANYTINGTTYYTATKDGRSALWNIVQGTTVPTNSNEYPSTLAPGHYIRINNVVPVGGAITIAANTDNLSFRSPLNGIQLIQLGKAPQILTPPLDHRLYTGGTLQLHVEAQSANTMTYRWRRNGVDLINGGNISGADTTSLTITNLVVGDTGDYDVVVSNSFGSATSEAKHTDVVVMTQADAAFEAWLATYKRVDERGATFITESIVDRYWAWAWQQAFMHWTVTDAYNHTPSPDHERLIYKLQNTFLKQEGNTLTWQNWNDDIQWEVIALSKGYPITGNPLARETAISAWNAVWTRGRDDTFGDGIWQKMPVGNSKTVLSNCPQIIGGLELYKITGDIAYIEKCEIIYDWVHENLFINTPEKASVDGLQMGQLIEGIAYLNDAEENGWTRLISNNVYNSGLFVQSACGLYEVTGNQQYLDDAILAANYMVNRQPIMDANNVNNGYFGAEQLVRGVARLASLNQNKLWPTYWPWMRAQCAAAWAMRRTDLNITRNRWTSPTPADIDLKALETHSAFLVQQLTPVTMPVTVDWANKLTGTIIGTTGTFSNGNTREKALDGNVATYFDAPTANANGAWVGLDLGTAKNISAIRYYPRTSEPDRMLGGIFQGANQANFSDAVTLYSVVIQPSLNVYHLMPVTSTQSFRYVRYLSPNGGFGNVSEVEFYAATPGPAAPTNMQARRNATSSILDWSPVAGAASYKVKRSTTTGGPYQEVAGSVLTNSYTDAISDPDSRYFYVVSGVSGSSVEGAISAEAEAVDAYRAWAIASGLAPNAANSAFNLDGDGDGISNGLEYGVPGGLKTAPPVGSDVQLTADVRVDEFLSIILLKSTDLNSWTPLPAMQVIEPSDAAIGFRRLSLTDPVGTEQQRNFYRIKVAR
ncbi:MAG: glycoside hydrolase family 76 protein [Verrucomicrobiota bacterium]